MDATEIIRQMRENPALAEEMRAVLLSEELLSLPMKVSQMDLRLTEQINKLAIRVEELATRLEELATRVEELAEAQSRTEARLEELATRVEELATRVEELAEAQSRTEARVEELAEAQSRTEARVEELAEAQRRTEARLEELAIRVEELAEAQKQANSAIGRLENNLGIAIEEAATVSVGALARSKGFTALGPAKTLQLNGYGEVDAVARLRLPDGHEVAFVAEAKMRLRGDDVRRLASQIDREEFRSMLMEKGYYPPYLPYVYGEVVYDDAVDAAEELGIGIYGPWGDRYDIQVIERR